MYNDMFSYTTTQASFDCELHFHARYIFYKLVCNVLNKLLYNAISNWLPYIPECYEYRGLLFVYV